MDPSINTSYSLEQKISISISKDYDLQQLKSNNFQLSNNSVSINPDYSLPSNNFQLSNNNLQNTNLNKTNKGHQQSDSVLNSNISSINNIQIIDNSKFDGNQNKQKQYLSLGTNCKNNSEYGNSLNSNSNSQFNYSQLIKQNSYSNNFQQHYQNKQTTKNKKNSQKILKQHNDYLKIKQVLPNQSKNISDSKQLKSDFQLKQKTSSLQNQSNSDFIKFNKLKIKNQDNQALQNNLHNQNQKVDSFIYDQALDTATKQYVKDYDLFNKYMSDNSTQIQITKQSQTQLNTMNSFNQSQEVSLIDFNINLGSQLQEDDNNQQCIKKYFQAQKLMKKKKLGLTYDYVQLMLKIVKLISRTLYSEQQALQILQIAQRNLNKISQNVNIQRYNKIYYQIYLYYSRIYSTVNKFEYALHYSQLNYQLTSKIFNQISIEKYALIHQRGMIYMYQQNHKQSLKYFIESYKILKQINGYYKQKFKAMNHIAKIYFKLQQYHKALKYLLEIKQFMQQNFLTRDKLYIIFLHSLGYTYIQMNDTQKAKQTLLQLQQLYIHDYLNNEIYPHYTIYYSLGLLQKIKQNYQKAIEYFQLSILVWKETKRQQNPIDFQPQVKQHIHFSLQKIQKQKYQNQLTIKINDSFQ